MVTIKPTIKITPLSINFDGTGSFHEIRGNLDLAKIPCFTITINIQKICYIHNKFISRAYIYIARQLSIATAVQLANYVQYTGINALWHEKTRLMYTKYTYSYYRTANRFLKPKQLRRYIYCRLQYVRISLTACLGFRNL